jgi:hypothetical protein
MAAENCLWGAPRIHGELLKLGIAISERTVSRYLRGRPPTRSQSWGTFFANHFGDRTPISPVMFADASGEDIDVDASNVSFRSAPSIIRRAPPFTDRMSNGSFARTPPLACILVTITFRIVQARVRQRPRPAAALRCAVTLAASGSLFLCALTERPTSVRNHSAAQVRHGDVEFVSCAIGSLKFGDPTLRSARRRSARHVVVRVDIRTAIRILAKHRIVADHHGSFTLESELRAGTAATVGLPVAADEA